jgi:hypothetical protein
MDDVGICYGYLVIFSAIWNIVWPFSTFVGYLEYFSRFGILYKEKSGNPDRSSIECTKKSLLRHSSGRRRYPRLSKETELPFMKDLNK